MPFRTLELPGTYTGDCTPAQNWVGMHPTGPGRDPHMTTSKGRVEIVGTDTPNQNVNRVVCEDYGGNTLYFAGSGDDDFAWLWNGSRWFKLTKTYGVSPCAFGPYGLYVSTPGVTGNVKVFDPVNGNQTGTLTKPIGVRGFASVEGYGEAGLHPQDSWYGNFGLGEYIMTGGYIIGQGTQPDGLQVANFGYLIPQNFKCKFIRAHHKENKFAIAAWLEKPDGRTLLMWPVVDFSTL